MSIEQPGAASAAEAVLAGKEPPPRPSGLSLTLLRPNESPNLLANWSSLLCIALAIWSGLEAALSPAGLRPELSAPSALSFIAVALAVLLDRRRPEGARRAPAALGIAFCFFALLHPAVSLARLFKGETGPLSSLLAAWGGRALDPFTAFALIFMSVCAAFTPSLKRRPGWLGDFLGTGILSMVTICTFFLVSYFPVAQAFMPDQAAFPSFKVVAATAALGAALIGRLGPLYFPIRPFVGPFVQAVLLRKFLPVALGAVMVYLVLERTVLVAMEPSRAAFLTLFLSALTVMLLILRSSAALSPQLEKALRENDQLYSELVRNLKDHGMVLLNEKGQIVLWNPGAERLTGYRAVESVGEAMSSLLFKPDRNLDRALEQAAAQGTTFIQEWLARKDGTPFWAEIVFSAILNGKGQVLGFSVVMRDFTERRKAEEKLQVSLRDKETMLKEIHHRVKNNLQVISSLLRLQSEKIQDEKTLALFRDSQERVRAMAMVHEFLYQSPDLAKINFSDYVKSLVRNLCRSYRSVLEDMNIQVDVDPVFLNLDVAVPCGLILTELVSNALKYAYPEGKRGPISVRFRAFPDHSYSLTVADEGAGLPPGLDWRNASSLGLQLVSILADQLRGQARLEPGPGTRFLVQFRGPKEISLLNGGQPHG